MRPGSQLGGLCWAGLPVGGLSHASVHAIPLPPFPLHLLNRPHDRPPDCGTLGIACLEHPICPLGRMEGRVLAVLVDQELGGAVDV